MNFAAGVGPLISSAFISINDGYWRPVMQFCGTVSCGYSFALMLFMKDKSEDVSLTFKKINKSPTGVQALQSHKFDSSIKSINSYSKKDNSSLWFRIFSSFYTYTISFGFLTAMFTKGIACDWGPLYLIQVSFYHLKKF